MIKVVILEDEEPAAKRLQKMIEELERGTEVVASIDSVERAIEWLNNHDAPDLIFSDIQLSDGISFEIFKSAAPRCPVIFITAYDQYALDAFKLNSIDYLLKPVKKEELKAAITKFKQTMPAAAAPLDIEKLLKAYGGSQPEYKKRFVVKYGEHIKTITAEEVAYFYTEDKINFLTTKEGRRFTVDFNLDTLESVLDPKIFFRINRQFIISINSIAEMFSYTKSRVLIKLNPPCKHETIVSTERSSTFKAWLGDGT
jgi:DNA-binding LytR/AlgR family response regulator